jgi:hypothetical protein
MKKIFFACDDDHFPNGAYRFLQSMQQFEPVSVTGTFFNQNDYKEFIEVGYTPPSGPYAKMQEEEKEMREKSIKEFVQKCKMDHIRYFVRDKVEPLNKTEFRKETRFSDLLLISEELYGKNIYEEQPNALMKEALHGSECPVMILPENFKDIERVVFAYDGQKECVFALKQFCYLLPQYTDLPIEIAFIKDEPNNEIPDKDLLNEFTGSHFNNLSFTKLHFDPRKFFSTWIENKKNVLLITGSFSRSSLSDILNESFTKRIIRDQQLPVFIAHHI